MISPTTCGARHLRASSAKNLALMRMMARFLKTEYIDVSFLCTLAVVPLPEEALPGRAGGRKGSSTLLL